MPRVLAIDPGERRIGIAVSDELGLLARPLMVLRGKTLREAVQAIARLVEQEHVEEVIVGLPLSLRGEVGHQARRSLRFVEELQRETPVGVRAWNEQFTTVEAQRRMIEAGQRRTSRARMLDAAAAAVLLQDYLDHRT